MQPGTIEGRPAVVSSDAVAVPLIGLTGGMGVGKSTALDAIGELGAAVLSTDKVVHELFGCQRIRQALVDRWGPEVAPDGKVARETQYFGDPFEPGASRAQWVERML